MSTGIANLLEEEKVEGYVSLTLAAMYEASLGAESVWSAYLALLANRTPTMASDLSEDARELMKKCEAYADIETDLVSETVLVSLAVCVRGVSWRLFSMWSWFVLLLFTFFLFCSKEERQRKKLKVRCCLFVYLLSLLLYGGDGWEMVLGIEKRDTVSGMSYDDSLRSFYFLAIVLSPFLIVDRNGIQSTPLFSTGASYPFLSLLTQSFPHFHELHMTR